jgi:hypothetical protein
MMEIEKAVHQWLEDLKIDSTTTDWDMDCKLRESKLSSEAMVDGGSSKICLIPYRADFVIKWAYADPGEFIEDEALKEVEMYQKAVKAGLEMFFPKTELFCTINGINFIKQEKIDFSVQGCGYQYFQKYTAKAKTASDKKVQLMEKCFKKAAPNGHYARDLDSLWAKMALVIYGKKLCKTLCEFIIENKINDLHEGNIGYKNDRPIILDFSGFDR